VSATRENRKKAAEETKICLVWMSREHSTNGVTPVAASFAMQHLKLRQRFQLKQLQRKCQQILYFKPSETYLRLVYEKYCTSTYSAKKFPGAKLFTKSAGIIDNIFNDFSVAQQTTSTIQFSDLLKILRCK
jgi:hypothetical protein